MTDSVGESHPNEERLFLALPWIYIHKHHASNRTLLKILLFLFCRMSTQRCLSELTGRRTERFMSMKSWIFSGPSPVIWIRLLLGGNHIKCFVLEWWGETASWWVQIQGRQGVVSSRIYGIYISLLPQSFFLWILHPRRWWMLCGRRAGPDSGRSRVSP